MALTLEVEQRLEAAGLVTRFDDDLELWKDLARGSYDYVKGNFPHDSRVRRDDVAKILGPIIEVNEGLRAYLNANKLKQKYWIKDFTDLIIDRTWNGISQGEQTNEQQ